MIKGVVLTASHSNVLLKKSSISESSKSVVKFYTECLTGFWSAMWVSTWRRWLSKSNVSLVSPLSTSKSLWLPSKRPKTQFKCQESLLSNCRQLRRQLAAAETRFHPPAVGAAAAVARRGCAAGRCPDWSASPAWRWSVWSKSSWPSTSPGRGSFRATTCPTWRPAWPRRPRGTSGDGERCCPLPEWRPRPRRGRTPALGCRQRLKEKQKTAYKEK